MASEGVAVIETAHPEMYGAPPQRGNYTDDASMHPRCANALAAALAAPEDLILELNDDIQSGLHYLLSCEVSRARAAAQGGELCPPPRIVFQSRRRHSPCGVARST